MFVCCAAQLNSVTLTGVSVIMSSENRLNDRNTPHSDAKPPHTTSFRILVKWNLFDQKPNITTFMKGGFQLSITVSLPAMINQCLDECIKGHIFAPYVTVGQYHCLYVLNGAFWPTV